MERQHPKLPVVRQRTLLGVGLFGLYHRLKGASEEDLPLMGEMDRHYLAPLLRVQTDAGLP